jgi:predicted GH43/DUF377 family glycosyl hydrolase
MRRVTVTRSEHRLLPDKRRVITRQFLPAEEEPPNGTPRIKHVINRILAIPEADVPAVLAEIVADFAPRHKNFAQVLEHSFQLLVRHLDQAAKLSRQRRLLLGAYFTCEYAIESAALFNPSIVPAPNQSGLAPGEQRFVMSLRAVGEGHISSIEFRTGTIDVRGKVRLDPASPYASTGRRKSPLYDKKLFTAKLAELGAANDVSSVVVGSLPDSFDSDDLERALASLDRDRAIPRAIAYETSKLIRLLASSNYVVAFSRQSDISERVLFPNGPNDSGGMEDARFVRFENSDGSSVYYATYTAYDGFKVFPQLIETEDFSSFRIATLNGECAQNKGMALFPRLIHGRYVMLSRFDRENTYLMTSDNVRFWREVDRLRTPVQPWELITIGNCGSPIETEAGWLVLTHGVGPMRKYAIGALLLDLDDPRKVIGQLTDPLLNPEADERDGYVPNVVYSCGAMIHGDNLVLPYGFADLGTGVAVVCLSDLLDLLLAHSCAA